MNKLLVAIFDTETAANSGLNALRNLHAAGDITLFATAVLVYLFKHLNPLSKLQSVAYGCVAGGAIGNLIDRFRLGSVTDFIQVHFVFVKFDFPWKLYPAFNIADSAICIGVAALIILTWRTPQINSPENAHAADAD